MTQFTETVEKRKLMIKAEEWAKETDWLHAHRLKSMWYDNRPEDTDDNYVIDVGFKSGLIERTLANGEVIYFGEKLEGEDLLNAYLKT